MPIDPSQTTVPVPPGPTASLQTNAPKNNQDNPKNSPFGPAYVLDPGLKSQVAQGPAGTVPFVVSSPGQTLASLPPLKPLGSAALTQLSLQHLLDPAGGDAQTGG